MAKLWVLLLVMVVCFSQTYLAARIVRNADTSESQSSESDSSSNEISENKEQTTLTEKDMVRIRKANITEADYRRVKDIYRDVKEWTPAAFATTLSKVCEILNPDLKESAVNVTPEQQVYFGKFVERTRAEVVDSDKILFAKNTICDYLHNPKSHEDKAKDMDMSLSQYHRFLAVSTTGRDQSLAGRLITIRKVCHIYQSAHDIGGLGPKLEAPELTAEQTATLEEMIKIAKSTTGAERHAAYMNICTFVNGTVSAEQQAAALGISVVLYQKIAEIRKKHHADESLSGRLNAARSICDEINKNERLLTNPITENLDHTPEQLEEFSQHLIAVRNSKPSERYGAIRDICVFLNKTHSIEEIAKTMGLTEEQVQQIQAITRTRDPNDRSVQTRVQHSKRACDILTPEDKLSENKKELTPEQETEFTEKAKAAVAAPLEDKKAKIEDLCTMIKTAIQS